MWSRPTRCNFDVQQLKDFISLLMFCIKIEIILPGKTFTEALVKNVRGLAFPYSICFVPGKNHPAVASAAILAEKAEVRTQENRAKEKTSGFLMSMMPPW